MKKFIDENNKKPTNINYTHKEKFKNDEEKKNMMKWKIKLKNIIIWHIGLYTKEHITNKINYLKIKLKNGKNLLRMINIVNIL